MNQQMKQLYEFGNFTLDVTESRLLRGGRPIPLKPKVLETLTVLVENPGHTLDKEELMKRLWPDSFVEEANLAVNISQLRKALGENENGQVYIETVPKRGYRFVAPVTKILADRVDMVVREHTRAHILVEEEETLEALESESALAPKPRTEKELAPAAWTTVVSSKAGAFGRRVRNYPKVAVAILVAIIIGGVGAGFGLYTLVKARSGGHFETIALTRLSNTRRPTVSAISPNGEFVAYAAIENGQASLWITQVASGSEVQIVSSERAYYRSIAFSSDGHHIYYSKESRNKEDMAVYEVPALGGVSRKVIADASGSFALSPDNDQIAFTRDHEEESWLLIAGTRGTEEKRLAVRKRPYRFDRVAWSRHGDVLVCSAIRADSNERRWELIEVRLADGTEHRIGSQGWEQISGLTWLADGSALLLAGKDQMSTPPQIWLVSYPDGESRRVTNDLAKYYDVSLTADSSTLVSRTGDSYASVWSVPNGGKGAHKEITSRGGRYFEAVWTPDGRLVYVSPTKSNLDIWIMASDGTNQKQLTSDNAFNRTPVVSKDGRYIFFCSYREGATNLWRIDIDGGNPKQLTNGKDNRHPQISPDGKWLLYVSMDSGVSTLWKIPLEGGKPVQLSAKELALPEVSPDGKMIACFYRVKPKSPLRLAVLPLEGSEPLKLFNLETGNSTFIGWTPDSQAITYTYYDEDGMFSIWNQPLDGRAPEKLTDFGADQVDSFDWSPDGQQLVVVRVSYFGDLALIRNVK